MAHREIVLFFCALSAMVAPFARADQAVIPSAADNTLYESATGALSNGSGTSFFSGRTGQVSGSIRRGLIRFDLTAIPPGSTIQSAALTLYCSGSSGGAQPVNLHRVLVDWGESSSVAPAPGGQGTTAAAGDATWLHTFSPTVFWSNPGGDFSGASSASCVVDLSGVFYTWGSTSGLVADVQGWVDQASTNHGWLLQGNEGLSNSSKRFETRETTVAGQRPVLAVTFLPPLPGDANCDGVVTVDDVPLFVSALLDATGYSGCDIRRADVNGDGLLDGRDVAALSATLLN